MSANNKRIGKRAEERVRKEFLQTWNLEPHCIVRNIASGTYEQEVGDLSFHLEKCGYKNPHLVVEVKRRKYIPRRPDSKVFQKFLEQLQEEREKYKELYKVTPSIMLVIVKPYQRQFETYYELSPDSNLIIPTSFPKRGITFLRTLLEKIRPIPLLK